MGGVGRWVGFKENSWDFSQLYMERKGGCPVTPASFAYRTPVEAGGWSRECEALELLSILSNVQKEGKVYAFPISRANSSLKAHSYYLVLLLWLSCNEASGTFWEFG